MTPTEKRILAAANTVCDLLEIGDLRLLASDGPAGNQIPYLNPQEWGRVYRACKVIVACAADAAAKKRRKKA